MKKLVLLSVCVGAIGLAVGFPAWAAGKITITLSGSSTVAPVMTEIAARYEKTHPDVRIDVQSGGSSKGVTDTRDGAVSIGMISRVVKPDETDLQGYLLALDGVAMIVHKTNKVTNLTKSQIVGIYTGKIKNWQEVGGADAPIVVVNKAEGRSTLEMFLHYTGLKNSEIKASTIIGENEQGIKYVSGNKNALAYVSIGSSEVSAAQGTPIKLVDLEGVHASTQTVKDRSFPMTRPLNLIIKKGSKLEPTIKDFLAYAQSKDVADIIKSNAFVVLDEK